MLVNRAHLLPLLACACLVGCNQSGEVIIRNDADFVGVNKEVRELSEKPMAKFDANQPLDPTDVQALKKALKLIDGMIAYTPDNFSLYLNAGTFNIALEDGPAAVSKFESFQQYIPNDLKPELKPLVTNGFYQFAIALFSVQRYAGADTAITRALQDEPNNATYLALRGSIRVQDKRIPEAIPDLKKALKINPSSKRAADLLKLLERK